MVEIDDTIEESWSFPPEGYNDDIEEDSDLEMVRFEYYYQFCLKSYNNPYYIVTGDTKMQVSCP